LVSKGFKVAIAEQTESAKEAKGLVKRQIVRVVSPATSLNLRGSSENNFFISVIRHQGKYALAALDITTGEFKAAGFDDRSAFLSEALSLKPSEVLTTAAFRAEEALFMEELRRSHNPLVTCVEAWHFEETLAEGHLTSHFKVLSLDGFGLKNETAAIMAAGALIAFVKETLSQPTLHVREIHTWRATDALMIDRTTQDNLELTESLKDRSRKNTLLETLDVTKTPMGARLLVQWIKRPLLSCEKIAKRQEAIEALFPKIALMQGLLSPIRDLERLVMKTASNLASPKDLAALNYSLKQIAPLKALLKSEEASLLAILEETLSPLDSLTTLLDQALVEDPPFRLSDGGAFRKGFRAELDELMDLASGSKDWLARYQMELKESTGIKTLKVGFTKVSGFYIEVSRGQASDVPDTFHRRQTLTNAERFITPELKAHEEKILHAEEKISALESALFQELKEAVLSHTDPIYHNAHAIAHLDALQSLAAAAQKWGWVKPEVNNGDQLLITEGRHPVIEAKGSEPFIPNDTAIDGASVRLMVITGPNMAGKSTYIRQNALIVLLAQIGSFVPAKSASIGLVDKLFTRIGASDDLTRGHSTFMVEMTETANILNNATDRSLVILDEIGRGTSTYDGIAIAWSVAEFLITEPNRRPKTLFATHFWELTKLEKEGKGAKNYTVAVHEKEGEIRFLRKIIPGSTDKSYGIHVAKLAGLPPKALERAEEILSHLETTAGRDKIFEPPKAKKVKKKEADPHQLVLF
jgi:DNA mismatch repair protein MutS